MERISTTEIAKELNINVQAVRVLAQRGKLPFIQVVENDKENAYYAWREHFELWKKQGKL